MRPLGHLAIICLGFVATGCASQADPETLEYRAELAVQARGLALYEDGQSGSAGMWNTTCEFTTDDGMTTSDLDAPGKGDSILDASTTALDGPSVIISSPRGTFIGFPESGSDPKRLQVLNLLDAAFINGGIVTLADPGQCEVSWGDSDDRVVTTIPDSLCDGPTVEIDTDFESGMVVVSNGDEGAAVWPDEVLLIDELGDLVAWDRYTRVIYAANSGSRHVRAHAVDGTLIWETEVGDAVVSLDDMGPIGAVLVMVKQANGSGEALVLDGASGELRDAVPTPTAAKVHVSDNGKVAAMMLNDTVHFYDVRVP